MAEFEPITDEAFERASDLERQEREGRPVAIRARYDRGRGRIVILLSTGAELGFPAKRLQGLERATSADLADIEVTGAGFGLRFPRLDVDLSVPRLMEGFLGSRDWMKRESRAIASRQNGKLGGRPRTAVA